MAEEKIVFYEEPELNRKLNGLIQAGKARMSAIQVMNRDAIRYVYGDQHAGKRRKKNWHYPVLNRMYADMTQEVAILSANNPRIDTPPREDTDPADAKMVGQVLKGVWSEELTMRIKIIQGLYDDHLHGVKVAKWFWEKRDQWDDERAMETGNGWKGKIEVVVVNPETFGCDPDVELAAEIPMKAEFVFTERWVNKQWAAARWSKYKEYLTERGELDDDTGELVREGSGRSTDETGFNRSTYDWSGKDGVRQDEEILQSRLADVILGKTKAGQEIGRPSVGSSVLVQEIYFKDYATEPVEAEFEREEPGVGEAQHIFQQQDDPRYYNRNRPTQTDNGGIPVAFEVFNEQTDDWPMRKSRDSYERPKYPNGRVVVRLNEEVIAENHPWKYERWPFAVAPNYLLPHLWAGPNCVELSRGFQDWMNIVASHMANYVKFFGDPQIWIEEGALAKDKAQKKGIIANYAGSIIRFSKGALRSKAVMRDSPPTLPPTLFQVFELFKQSDQDLKGLHDVAQGRASKGQNTLGELDMLNRNTRQRIGLQGALLDVWLQQIGWGVVRLMQDYYEIGDWVKWSSDEPDDVNSAVAWTQKMKDAKFDLRLEPVSTLPYDEERVIAKYIKAFEIAGPAMIPEVLKKMKIQNIPEILMKHELLGPLMQLMEMAQEMGKGPQELLQAIQAQLKMQQMMAQPAEKFNAGVSAPDSVPPALPQGQPAA